MIGNDLTNYEVYEFRRRPADGFFLIVLIVSICFFLAGFSNQVDCAERSSPKDGDIKTSSGVIDTVSLPDTVKGTRSEIVIVNPEGNKMVFLVKHTTTLYGKQSEAITLEKFKAGDKVKVRYMITKEGIYEATSVRMTPE